jgi:hypothetical protein
MMNTLLFSMVIAVVLSASVIAVPEPTVELGFAANYVILAKAGISTVPGPQAFVTGDIAVSPIAGAAMTGFAFTRDSSGEFSTATGEISGKAYAADFTAPTPSKLTDAVDAMMVAYTDAAGRLNPNAARNNLGGGLLGGVAPGGPNDQLTPGVYTFGSSIHIGGNLHFDGAGVYIIQVAGDLDMDGDYSVILENGALAENIFWQVSGAVNIGARAHMEGTILTATAVTFMTESTLNGRIYAQTAVALQMAVITCHTADGTCSA